MSIMIENMHISKCKHRTKYPYIAKGLWLKYELKYVYTWNKIRSWRQVFGALKGLPCIVLHTLPVFMTWPRGSTHCILHKEKATWPEPLFSKSLCYQVVHASQTMQCSVIPTKKPT